MEIIMVGKNFITKEIEKLCCKSGISFKVWDGYSRRPEPAASPSETVVIHAGTNKQFERASSLCKEHGLTLLVAVDDAKDLAGDKPCCSVVQGPESREAEDLLEMAKAAPGMWGFMKDKVYSYRSFARQARL